MRSSVGLSIFPLCTCTLGMCFLTSSISREPFARPFTCSRCLPPCKLSLLSPFPYPFIALCNASSSCSSSKKCNGGRFCTLNLAALSPFSNLAFRPFNSFNKTSTLFRTPMSSCPMDLRKSRKLRKSLATLRWKPSTLRRKSRISADILSKHAADDMLCAAPAEHSLFNIVPCST